MVRISIPRRSQVRISKLCFCVVTARITLRGDRVRLRKTCPYNGVSEAYQTDHFERSRYAKEADILGTFYDIHGTSDTGPVKLSGLGWDEMMQNVVKLEVVYDEGDEEQPGKQGWCRTSMRLELIVCNRPYCSPQVIHDVDEFRQRITAKANTGGLMQ